MFPPPPAPGETPIYKLVFFNPKSAYYEEQEKVQELVNGQNDIAKEIGREIIISAYSRMNNEADMTFMIERYPNLAAMVAH